MIISIKFYENVKKTRLSYQMLPLIMMSTQINEQHCSSPLLTVILWYHIHIYCMFNQSLTSRNINLFKDDNQTEKPVKVAKKLSEINRLKKPAIENFNLTIELSTPRPSVPIVCLA